MARRGASVLPFPVMRERITAPDSLLAKSVLPQRAPPNDSQLDALPQSVALSRCAETTRLLSNPEIAALRLQHEMLRLERLKSVLSPTQVLIVESEVALFAQCMDRIELDCKRLIAAQAKAVGLIA